MSTIDANYSMHLSQSRIILVNCIYMYLNLQKIQKHASSTKKKKKRNKSESNLDWGGRTEMELRSQALLIFIFIFWSHIQIRFELGDWNR